jgi:hypothetical protein|tara:strand:+ start:4132 stop:4398 length:267 start_codon:yes stop_codon:yes gene_type:complete
MVIFAGNKEAFSILKARIKCYDLIQFIITIPIFMSNIHSTNFLTAKNQINRVSEADLLKALEEVKTNNDNFRKSFKSDNEAMSIKAGR